MKARVAYSGPSHVEPENLDEWLLALDEFSNPDDLDDTDELRPAVADPARQPLD